MEKIDISKLREETQKAIERGKELNRLKNLEHFEKEKSPHRIAKDWAESHFASIPALAMRSAQEGKNFLTIANTRGCYDAVVDHNNEFLNWNTGKNGLKYFLLEEMLIYAGFQVDVIFEHDGVGMFSWYEMLIKW
jgi:hypothetical protein